MENIIIFNENYNNKFNNKYLITIRKKIYNNIVKCVFAEEYIYVRTLMVDYRRLDEIEKSLIILDTGMTYNNAMNMYRDINYKKQDWVYIYTLENLSFTQDLEESIF